MNRPQKNFWRMAFLAHIHMLMETLGIKPPGPAQSLKSLESFPRAQRENRPCCLMTGGQHQHGRFHWQGRTNFRSDAVRELQVFVAVNATERDVWAVFRSRFYDCTRVRWMALRTHEVSSARSVSTSYGCNHISYSLLALVQPCVCVCVYVHRPNTRTIKPSWLSHD